jgi:type I restriction-modification system DNA methylase subunit
MSKTFEQGKEEVVKLCQHFTTNRQAFFVPGVKEAHIRQILIDPFFEALGWDVGSSAMVAPQYREVIPEDSLDVEGQQKAPDYTFRVGTLPKFYAEAKKCGANIGTDPGPAFQLRRYGWSAKLALSVLTDFEELSVYDCTIRPKQSDKASHARVLYFGFQEYPDRWRELWDLFSREAVWSGAFDQYAASKRKRGTSEVDAEFLKEIEGWRDVLAKNMALRNEGISSEDLNAAVQSTIDRVVFLRMAEDRRLEPSDQLLKLCEQEDVYARFMRELCRKADDKYNSGLFHFDKEQDTDEDPDRITPKLTVDDKVFKPILESLYFAHGSPYQFDLLPVEILGTVYERFLGKVIRLTTGHQAKVEEKPEVRKAGGVYYTPKYIVDYSVEETVGRQIEGKSPAHLAGLHNGKQPFRVLDMACGSGSFLLGAFQRLLDHCLQWYVEHNPEKHKKAVYKIPNNGHWRLTIGEKKRILTTHIFGVDIDAQAVEVTKLSLLLKVLEGETDQSVSQQHKFFHDRALPNLSDNIKCGNSLIGSDYFAGKLIPEPEEMKRVNPFDWKQEFPDAMKDGGFDCIIGNPPYVRPHKIDSSIKRYFWDNYHTFVKKSDLYCVFIEKALTLLKTGGMLGYIVSNGWLRLDSFQKLRELLLSQTAIHAILEFRDNVFEEATVKTNILVLSKETIKNNRLHLARVDAGCSIESVKFRKLDQAIFAKQYKSIFDLSLQPAHEKIKARMRAFKMSIGDQFDVSFGLKTGDDSKFLTFKKKSGKYKPLLRGEDVHQYSCHWKGEYVWYAPEEMRRHRKTARPGTVQRFEQTKVLVRDTGAGLECTLDDQQYFVKDVIILSSRSQDKGDLLYLTGLLNSRLMRFYYETSFPTLHVQRNELASLPYRPINAKNAKETANRQRIEHLVEQMLSLKDTLAFTESDKEHNVIQRQIDATDREIDRLVYDLYGLSEEEIAIVEGSDEATAQAKTRK